MTTTPTATYSEIPLMPTSTFTATTIKHRFRSIMGVEMFYREAGNEAAPVIVLLGGHPTGAHAYNGLIDRLAAKWHVIAPDYPGYGFSGAPADAPWTFDWLAEVTNALLEDLSLKRYVLYMHDFGAPVGFRIAEKHPERIAGLVTQSANIYKDGLGPAMAALAAWWNDRAGGQAAVDEFLALAGTRMQWEAGAARRVVNRSRDVDARSSAHGRHRAAKRSQKHYSGTIKTTMDVIPAGSSISARINRLCSAFGARTIRSLFRRELKRFVAMFRPQK